MYDVSTPSFRGARRASPESILPIVVMDSGLVASRRPGMTAYVLNELGRRAFAFSRPDQPEFCSQFTLTQNERAQGMPGEGLTHGPPAKKMQAAGTTGSAEHPAFPARCLHAYTQSPWRAGLVGRHAATMLAHCAGDTSIGVSERCDFTSAIVPVVCASRASGMTCGTASRPDVRDDAYVPLQGAGRRGSYTNSGKTKEKFSGLSKSRRAVGGRIASHAEAQFSRGGLCRAA